MDFSFVSEDSTLSRRDDSGTGATTSRAGAAHTPGGGATGAGRAVPTIAIPSFREVQHAEQRRAPGVSLFRPSGLSLQQLPNQTQPTGAGPCLQHQHQQQQQQQQHNRWPQPTAPTQQHQHQHHQQQHAHPPSQPPGGSGAPAAAPPASFAARAAMQVAAPALALPRFTQGAGPSGGGAGAPPAGPGSAPVLPPGGAGGPPFGSQRGAAAPHATSAAIQLAQHQAAQASNAILVSQRQQGNPLLPHIRNVRCAFADIVPDFVLGQHTAALFLSLRYHLLYPSYLLSRICSTQRAYRLLALVVHCDTEEVVQPLADITKTAITQGATLLVGWSHEECARYLETLKAYESRPATSIQERTSTDYVGQLTAALTCVRGVNRTDAVALGRKFGTLADLLRATPEQLSACPGLGPVKVQRLHEAFHEPFRRRLAPVPVPAANAASAPTAAAAAVAAAAVGAAEEAPPPGTPITPGQGPSSSSGADASGTPASAARQASAAEALQAGGAVGAPAGALGVTLWSTRDLTTPTRPLPPLHTQPAAAASHTRSAAAAAAAGPSTSGGGGGLAAAAGAAVGIVLPREVEEDDWDEWLDAYELDNDL